MNLSSAANFGRINVAKKIQEKISEKQFDS